MRRVHGAALIDSGAMGHIVKPFFGLCWHAAIYRYRGSVPRGLFLLCLSVLDVLVYAVVLAAVVESVFAMGGRERFVLTLIGLVAFRWSLSCAVQASRTAHIARILSPGYLNPVVVAVILSVAGPTLVFLISSSFLVAGLLVTSSGTPEIIHLLGWGLFVAIVQLSWNCALSLVVIAVRLRQLLVSELPIVFAFVLLLIISPVAYQFSDIPPAASRMLTSLNPASHLIAGYQNALWYMQNVSLEVLPLSALVAIAISAVIGIFMRQLVLPQSVTDRAHTMVLHWRGNAWHHVDHVPEAEKLTRYTRWDGEMPWISGVNLIFLLEALPGSGSNGAAIFAQLAKDSESEGLLDTPLPILSHKNRDRLCAALALSTCVQDFHDRENVVRLALDHRLPVVLDGLFDEADSRELDELSRVLRAFQVHSMYLTSSAPHVAETLLQGGHGDTGPADRTIQPG